MSTFRTTISTLNASVTKSLNATTDSLDLLTNYISNKKQEQQQKSRYSLIRNVTSHKAECLEDIQKSLDKITKIAPETIAWVESQL